MKSSKHNELVISKSNEHQCQSAERILLDTVSCCDAWLLLWPSKLFSIRMFLTAQIISRGKKVVLPLHSRTSSFWQAWPKFVVEGRVVIWTWATTSSDGRWSHGGPAGGERALQTNNTTTGDAVYATLERAGEFDRNGEALGGRACSPTADLTKSRKSDRQALLITWPNKKLESIRRYRQVKIC